jgi:hypothetical protein
MVKVSGSGMGSGERDGLEGGVTTCGGVEDVGVVDEGGVVAVVGGVDDVGVIDEVGVVDVCGPVWSASGAGLGLVLGVEDTVGSSFCNSLPTRGCQ